MDLLSSPGFSRLLLLQGPLYFVYAGQHAMTTPCFVRPWIQLNRANPHHYFDATLTGGLAGAISRTATAPIDRLRMLQQVNNSRSLLSMRKVRPQTSGRQAPPVPDFCW